MSCYFGLYFGNTNMCLAMHKDSKTEVLANAAGYRVTPSVIAFLDESEQVVGLDAKQAMLRNPSNAVTNIKDLITISVEPELNNLEAKSKNTVNGKKNSKTGFEKNGISQLGTSDFLVILFSNMKEIACSHSHEDEYPAVVTVPLTFTQEQREKVEKAVNEAGFQLLRIISEPSAAALAYNIGQDTNDSISKCLVFRMGGTSIDVTILQVSNGMYSVLSSVQKKNFGGHQFTDCVVNFCASEFQRQYKVDIKENKRSVMKLRAAAELYKHVVYGTTNERCQAESLYDGIDLNVNISRARFESLIQNTLQQCLDPVHEALNTASLSTTDINTVILSGGCCKIPKLQQLISNTFSSASTLYSIVPDEVIAVGAAKQATLVSQSIDEEDCYVNFLSQDITLKLTGFSNCSEELLMCSKGTLIPTVITQSFTVTQTSNLKVEIFESNSDSSEENTKSYLAVLNMPNLPVGDVYFSFHIKSDGSLFVSCKDCASKDLGSATIIPPRTQGYSYFCSIR
ncbi:heat shock 70 kDa protein 14 [Nephila pilipes]|uniref:Heat shock 70 kDa protein 14 n=1 Tax=Nephila pilipes TaxID=299642 RepID=A0A8X6MJJ1_NEPPI|nr:heat shock 70 kDa protein 14 [Nephila pilipes]